MAQVLVIDDDRGLRRMVRLTLQKAGHSVEAAENGGAGLERFADGDAWDLTLVDQRMPDMEGIQVIREARRRDPAARMVMITAFGSRELAADALYSGAADFLRKPFSADTLRGAVAAALGRPRRVAPLPDELGRGADPGAETVSGGVPHIQSFINGFYYWPLGLGGGPQPRPVPAGIEICRSFRVRQPTGEHADTLVGVTAHVRDEVGLATGRDCGPEDPLWGAVCQLAVMDYLWDEAKLPPEFLPLYELTSDRMEDIRTRQGFFRVPYGPE